MAAIATPILSLVYVSSAAQPFSSSELLELVQKAQASNARHGITGVLLHKDGSFMQVLEGPESGVKALAEKIQRDRRHTSVLTLLTRNVEKPQFPDWSMGLRDPNTLTRDEMNMFAPYLSLATHEEIYANSAPAALRLLRSFKTNMR
jgi:Sensors of blue-light using FAD